GGLMGDGEIDLKNTIVTSNHAPSGPDLGRLTFDLDANYCLIGNTSGTTVTIRGSNNILDGPFAGLGPLGNYGGRTQTNPLLPTSPARGAGSPLLAADLTTDQRGQPRKVNGLVDIGAFQSQERLMVTTASDSPGHTGISLRDAVNLAEFLGATA